MARVAGVDLPQNKAAEIGLTYIFGIGRTTSRFVLSEANVPLEKKIRDLNDEELARIRSVIENRVRVEGSLRTQTSVNIKRLMDIGSYRGLRHRRGLPVRGQRTQTNSRTRKGPRRTVANKKEAPGKG